MSPPKISVCIPAYEMNGQGATYLEASFEALRGQDFDDFDVIVSDQSRDMAVHDLCEGWRDRLTIRHIWNRDAPRQASANVNRALDEAEGEILKILFQDDYLCATDALSQIYSTLHAGEAKWLLTGSGVTRDGDTIERPMIPKLTEKLHFGKNTVSSPSVLALRQECTDRFDTDLIWLMDVEFYRRLWNAHGAPAIVPEVLVANRLHDGQVSAGIDRALQARELDHVWRAHAATTQMSGKLEYARRRIKTLLASGR